MSEQVKDGAGPQDSSASPEPWDPEPVSEASAAEPQVEEEAEVEPKVRTSRRGWVVTAVAAAVAVGALVWTAQDPRLGLSLPSLASAPAPSGSADPSVSAPAATDPAGQPGAEPSASASASMPGQEDAGATASSVLAIMYGAHNAELPADQTWREGAKGLATDKGLGELDQRVGSLGADYATAKKKGWNVRAATTCEQDGGQGDSLVLQCSSVVVTVGADSGQVSDGALGAWPFKAADPRVDRLAMVKQDGVWRFDGFAS